MMQETIVIRQITKLIGPPNWNTMLPGSLLFLHPLPAQTRATFVPECLFKTVCMVNSLRSEKVSPSGAEVSFVQPSTIRECLPWGQSLGMLTDYYKRSGSLNSQVLFCNTTNGVCRCHMAFFFLLCRSQASWNWSKC